jgi:hypothetical protein
MPGIYPEAVARGAVILVAAIALVLAAGAFVAGRESVDRGQATVPKGSYATGYRAGREDAFSGFDGGWAFRDPYIVTLRRGGPGITYRFARRWPLLPGFEYRACGRGVCRRRR